ncbi:competence protein CoiA [Bacillus rubiinfantis]|uniref:competence protein CoiA n=1 Tax=Bacillus rubiinfantis TaxID=1499680 RepID=UPI0005AB78AC|nr:competence protein CoiA family protein [Bacillus rubiinfantis]
MLTARTKTGKTICLAQHYTKNSLLSIREREEFVCPVCGQALVLKLGNERIFHFAHKQGSSCLKDCEGETETHIKGKLQLYHWLRAQNIKPILEYYDKEMKQRPDIMFEFGGNKFALEYQCSRLSDYSFGKRTRMYLKHQYIPLWILSDHHLTCRKNYTVPLSNFHYLFLRSSPLGNLYIPAYSPEKKLFHFIDSIIPYSVNNAFARHFTVSHNHLTLSSLINPMSSMKKLTFPQWETKVEQFKQNWSLNPRAFSSKFLQQLYKRNMNLFLLPVEIGLPVWHTLYFKSPAIIWQTYIFLDVFVKKIPGDLFTIDEITNAINWRIKRGDINLRYLPQCSDVTFIKAITEYLAILKCLNVISKVGDTRYLVKEKIVIPKTNREREEARLLLHQKINSFSQKPK